MPRYLCALILAAATAFGQMTPPEKTANMESFEQVWQTVRDRHPDPKLNGLNWKAIHDGTRPQIAAAKSMDEVREILNAMVGKLASSHYAVIPGEYYKPLSSTGSGAGPGVTMVVVDGQAVVGSVDPDSPAAKAGLKPGMTLDKIEGADAGQVLRLAEAAGDKKARKLEGGAAGKVGIDFVDDKGAAQHLDLDRIAPKGKLVTFGNLPEQRVFFESRRMAGGAGYIHFNEFLDPVSIMPQFEAAVTEFAQAPGIILDLRGNPGGIGIMAMGIAGFFVSKEGQKLGEMKMREVTLKFVIYPRAQVYEGPLAVLVDGGSASTSEIFAQGMQDLGRARVFGTRTAGAALPSDIVRLPNGDGFQYAQAGYTSEKGKVLEGAGVTPDEVVQATRDDLSTGRDAIAEAAEKWITGLRR